jgi:hypothetical protein
MSARRPPSLKRSPAVTAGLLLLATCVLAVDGENRVRFDFEGNSLSNDWSAIRDIRVVREDMPAAGPGTSNKANQQSPTVLSQPAASGRDARYG